MQSPDRILNNESHEMMIQAAPRTTEDSEAVVLEEEEGYKDEAATMVTKEFRKMNKPSSSQTEIEEVEENKEVEGVEAHKLSAHRITNTSSSTNPNTDHHNEVAARLQTSSSWRQEVEVPQDTRPSLA